MNIDDKLYERIDALAKVLEVSASQLYVAMIKRAKAQAVVSVIYAVGGLATAAVGGAGFNVFAHKAYSLITPEAVHPSTYAPCEISGTVDNMVHWMCGDVSPSTPPHDGQTAFMCVLSIVCLIAMLVGLYSTWDDGTDAVHAVMAPEAEAIRDIVNIARGE